MEIRLATTPRVITRNNLGQFARDCERAAGESVKDMIEEGAELSRGFAPTGHKGDPRTVTLKAGMYTKMLSRTQGIWGNMARHALPIETGAAPHEIPGNVSFFWEREGRMWIPGTNIINHPGNAAQPFLRPAYRIIARKSTDIMRRHYPS